MKQLLIIILVACLAGCYSITPEKTGKEGEAFPAFGLLQTDSVHYFNTAAVPTGKPSALFYFGTHCPYSKEQMKEIVDDMDRLKDINFYLVTRSPLSAVKKFYAQYHLDKYPNITVGLDTGGVVGKYYEVSSVPFMAVYGSDKKLNKAYIGAIYAKDIIAAAK